MCTMCSVLNAQTEGCSLSDHSQNTANGTSAPNTNSGTVSNYTALITGNSWAPNYKNGATIITYSFNSALSATQLDDLGRFYNVFGQTAEPFSFVDKAMFREALSLWEAVSGLEFVEVAEGQGTMAVHKNNWQVGAAADFAGWAYYPEGTDSRPETAALDGSEQDVFSDVFLNSRYEFDLDLMLHEIGHAIGLKHTFEDGVINGAYRPAINPDLDSSDYSVMSYNRPGDPTTLGAFDDDAAQAIYGTTKSKVASTYELSNLGAAQTMTDLRDFDGNLLGDTFAWRKIGEADVQGDGDSEWVYINTALGRWATLGPDGLGLVDFGDHGAGGDTRVVGIYIDPLVTSGVVVAGSDVDSQQRFQRDLESGNISGVLGQGDYDGDGLNEMYFSIADGSAYLHAYMHADGNIRYANYQSAQQVAEFMQTYGVDASVYDTWIA